MIIIAFCCRTSKIMPRIFCRHFRHCAPIIPNPNNGTHPYTMYQFVRREYIVKIPLNMRDMNLLRRAGWVFIYTNATPPKKIRHAHTCVGFCRHAIGLRRRRILTPDDLYRYLRRNT